MSVGAQPQMDWSEGESPAGQAFGRRVEPETEGSCGVKRAQREHDSLPCLKDVIA